MTTTNPTLELGPQEKVTFSEYTFAAQCNTCEEVFTYTVRGVNEKEAKCDFLQCLTLEHGAGSKEQFIAPKCQKGGGTTPEDYTFL